MLKKCQNQKVTLLILMTWFNSMDQMLCACIFYLWDHRNLIVNGKIVALKELNVLPIVFGHYITDPATMLLEGQQEEHAVTKRFHYFLKEYQERIDHFKPNTAISACMEWLNDATAQQMKLSKKTMKDLLVALSCMIPCMTSEALEQLFSISLDQCSWPLFDPVLAARDEATIIIQVNGKMRAECSVPTKTSQKIIQEKAEKLIEKWITGKKIHKIIFVPDRLINFVVQE